MYAKLFEFSDPLFPCLQADLTYATRFTHPPLLRPLFHDPLPPPMRTSYLEAPLEGILPVLLEGESEEDVLPDGPGKHPRFLGGVADGAADADRARVDRDLPEQVLEQGTLQGIQFSTCINYASF